MTKGLDVTYVSEYLMVSLVQVNYWQTLMSYVQLSKKKKLDEDNRMRDQFDTIMFSLMRFLKVKEIDEEIIHEIKEDGVQAFDKYRNFAIKLAENEDRLTQKYKGFQAQL